MTLRRIFNPECLILTLICLVVLAHTEECREKGNHRFVLCTGYENIPRDLNSEIIGLGFKGANNISTLFPNEFTDANLINLAEITLSNSKLKNIDSKAFENMKNLRALDLSNNQLNELQLNIFIPMINLQVVSLAKNRNLSLLHGVFPVSEHLQEIDLSNCNLSSIDENVFKNLENLEILYLNGNRFKTLSENVLIPLHQLKTFDLRDNPWNCDCYLRKVIERMFFSPSYSSNLDKDLIPYCTEPLNLANKTWDKVDTKMFHCHPKINSLKVNGEIEQDDRETFYTSVEADITVECEFWADPPADVQWIKDNKPLINSSTESDTEGVHIIQYNSYNHHTRSLKLIITKIRQNDNGEYKCQGENVGGVVMKTVFINVTEDITIKSSPWALSKTVFLFLISALTILVVAISLICCTLILRREKTKPMYVVDNQVLEFKSSSSMDDFDNYNERVGRNHTEVGAPLLRQNSY